MKNLTWQNPEQQKFAQVLIKKVKLKCCGILGEEEIKRNRTRKKGIESFLHAFLCFYATAHDTPNAVPIAANTAEARFQRNLISLDLFSCVILKNTSFLNENYFNHSSLIVFSSPPRGGL